MKNSKVYLISILLLLFFSCNNNNDDNCVELKPTQKEFLVLGKPNRIIQLETSDSSKIGAISKTEFDIANDRIFVMSDFNVFIFDNNGQFIHKLKKGRGPGEISIIVSFSVNTSSKLLYVLDNTNRICVFDYEGIMLKEYPITGFNSLAIQVIDDENAFLLCNWVGGNEEKFVGLYNFKEKNIVKKFVSSEDSQYPTLVRFMENNFTVNGEKLFFTSSNIFGLYEFEEGEFEKILSYDLGERSVPKRFSDKFLEGRRRTIFEDEALKNGYVPFILYSFCFKGYYFAIIDDNRKSCYVIDSKNLSKVFLNGTLAAYFNLPDVKSFRYPEEIKKDYLVFSCNPLDFFEIDDVEKTKSIEIGNLAVEINYDSNPFLIVVD